MRDFFTWYGPQPETGSVLLIAFGGFYDAGGCSTSLAAHILKTLTTRRVGGFDADALYVYSANRGAVTLDHGRVTAIQAPGLELHEVTDTNGRNFLLLAGTEPDLNWTRLAMAVAQLCDQLNVPHVVYTGGVQWSAPHTRPIGLIGQGTNPLVTSQYGQPAQTMRVSSSAEAFIEMGVASEARHVTGFYAKVPAYMASRTYGPALAAILDAVATVTGVNVPTTGLDGAREHARIEEQAQTSPGLAMTIKSLEEEHDRAEGESAAVADDLVSQIEEFLADQ